MIVAFGWRSLFFVSGVLGLMWLLIWLRVFELPEGARWGSGRVNAGGFWPRATRNKPAWSGHFRRPAGCFACCAQAPGFGAWR